MPDKGDLVSVPLPGAAHPAFTEGYVVEFLGRPVGSDGTIKVMRGVDVDTFQPAQMVMPYGWIVWLDQLGRGIAQQTGKFMIPTFDESMLITPPLWATRHIELPVQQGPS